MTVASEIQKALFLEQRGRFAEAVAGYKSIVDREPGNVDALFLLGRAYCQTGRFQDGAALFRKVIARHPKHAPAHTLLGRVAAQGGDLEGALTSYDRAIAADPNSAMAFANKADALDALGRHAEAVEAYDKALGLEPSNLAAWCNRGSALQALDREAEAVDSFRRALALKPDMVEVHFNLANALRASNQPDAAIDHYRRAIALRPGFAEAYINLAAVFLSHSRWDEAVQCCETAGRLRPEVMPYNTLGLALMNLGRYDESLSAFDKLLAKEPDNARGLKYKARALYYLGRMDEARGLLARAIEADPDDYDHFLLLDEIEGFKRGKHETTALRDRLLSVVPKGPDEDARINFALGNISRRLGEHDQAFHYLVKANALVREKIDYDVDADLQHFDRTRQAFTPDYLRRMAGHGDPSEKPIFVIGMPRSGTTLTEQILAAHPRVYGAGEVMDFEDAILSLRQDTFPEYPQAVLNMTPAELSALGADYLARISKHALDVDRTTDKRLGNNMLRRDDPLGAAERAHHPRPAQPSGRLHVGLFVELRGSAGPRLHV